MIRASVRSARSAGRAADGRTSGPWNLRDARLYVQCPFFWVPWGEGGGGDEPGKQSKAPLRPGGRGGFGGRSWPDSCGLRIVVHVVNGVKWLEHGSIGAEHQLLYR